LKSIISGTGSELPALVIPNSYFENHQFYDNKGNPNEKSGAEIIAKLEAITGIYERRFVPFDQDSVPLMTAAAHKAVADAGLDINQLSGIIVAHNAGNMVGGTAFHTVPNMAALLKNALVCSTHECFAYDIMFGCPGWLQGVIQAHQVIQCGDAEHILVVGLEIASRLLDPHDLDSMIMADGCGACVVSKSEDNTAGVISYATFSHAQEDLKCIYLDKSKNAADTAPFYFHMNGSDVYKYATQWVPKIVKKALDKAQLSLTDIDLFLFHQANAKILTAIANNLTRLYEMPDFSFEGKIPSTIQFLGNTSVATIPTMLDLIRIGELEGFEIKKGQKVVFASVGAGMHCNAMIYQF
jgi:3-oxoacyl-[acyl-carrier-protein] synthase III